MEPTLVWDEDKRQRNLAQRGLDFADATLVLASEYRLDVDVERHNELRTHSFAYVFEELAVLSLVHTARGEQIRIISFRRASLEEREVYHEWLAEEFKD